MLGSQVIALYIQLKDTGFFDEVRTVVDLEDSIFNAGTNPHLLEHLYERFGVTGAPSGEVRGRAADLYARLGFEYTFVTTKGRWSTGEADLNTGAVGEGSKARFDLLTNFGTTPRLLNQTAAFGAIHELVRPGGFMLHAVPFMGFTENAFYCYQPTFFESLARTNGYREIGMWINLGDNYPFLIPFDRGLLKVVDVPTLSDSSLVVLLQKEENAPLMVPYQRKYEFSRTLRAAARYGYVVDGQIVYGDKGWIRSHRKRLELFPLAAIVAELERRDAGIAQKIARPDLNETKKAELQKERDDVRGLLEQWKGRG